MSIFFGVRKVNRPCSATTTAGRMIKGRATRLNKERLIFVKGEKDDGKHPKIRALIEEAGAQLIRRRFVTIDELTSAVYASLL